jgi:hypothetical protein
MSSYCSSSASHICVRSCQHWFSGAAVCAHRRTRTADLKNPARLPVSEKKSSHVCRAKLTWLRRPLWRGIGGLERQVYTTTRPCMTIQGNWLSPSRQGCQVDPPSSPTDTPPFPRFDIILDDTSAAPRLELSRVTDRTPDAGGWVGDGGKDRSAGSGYPPSETYVRVATDVEHNPTQKLYGVNGVPIHWLPGNIHGTH